MIRQKIIAITKQGITSRGNPSDYWVVLECGHVYVTSYSINIRIKEFSLLQNLNPTSRCRDCEQKRPVSVELLEKYTPYKVWNAQNFDRFRKGEIEEAEPTNGDQLAGD